MRFGRGSPFFFALDLRLVVSRCGLDRGREGMFEIGLPMCDSLAGMYVMVRESAALPEEVRRVVQDCESEELADLGEVYYELFLSSKH